MLLLFQGQRYKIKSNSQQEDSFEKKTTSCCFKGKDTKLKAIHNSIDSSVSEVIVVVSRAKIQN